MRKSKQAKETLSLVALRLIVVLSIGAGVCFLLKAGIDSVYFENTSEALATASYAKYWAVLGITFVLLGLILARIVHTNSRNNS